MEKTQRDSFIGRLFGGLNMSWPAVIIFAVSAAVITAVFLICPVFTDTSFERMGVYLEAWIFFAVIIMANCKKPLESALKVFVFFLISQPLIYLIEVPFSDMGWRIFGYYRYWFMLTLLTFPGAFVGWYINKRNWLSLLVLSPVLVFLGMTAWECGQLCLRHFPRLLFTVLFCVLQIVLYILAFLPDRWMKAAGCVLALLGAAYMILFVHKVQLDTAYFLPDDPVLSESAELTVEEGTAAVSLERTGADSMVRIIADSFGTTYFTIRDGDALYSYVMEITDDDAGHTQIEIRTRDKGV